MPQDIIINVRTQGANEATRTLSRLASIGTRLGNMSVINPQAWQDARRLADAVDQVNRRMEEIANNAGHLNIASYRTAVQNDVNAMQAANETMAQHFNELERECISRRRLISSMSEQIRANPNANGAMRTQMEQIARFEAAISRVQNRLDKAEFGTAEFNRWSQVMAGLINRTNEAKRGLEQLGRSVPNTQQFSDAMRPLLDGIAQMTNRTPQAINALQRLIRAQNALADARTRYEQSGRQVDFDRYVRLANLVDRCRDRYNATQRAAENLNRTANSGINDTNTRLNSLLSTLSTVKTTLIGMGTLHIFKSIGTYADRYQEWINKLTAATGSNTMARNLMPDLTRVANEARTDIDSIVTLYSRLTLANDNLKLKEQDLITVTKSLSQSFILSGATTYEAKNAIIQFTQALSKGYLNGDELRSVTEQNIVFTRLLAKEMNTTAGGLRDLGAKGLLTAEILANVLKKSANSFEAQLSKMPVTFSQALQKLENSWQTTFSKMANDQQLGKAFVNLMETIERAFTNPSARNAISNLISLMKLCTENIFATGVALVSLRVGFASYAQAVTTATGITNKFGMALKRIGVGILVTSLAWCISKLIEMANEEENSIDTARNHISVLEEQGKAINDVGEACSIAAEKVKQLTAEQIRQAQVQAGILKDTTSNKIRKAYEKSVATYEQFYEAPGPFGKRTMGLSDKERSKFIDAKFLRELGAGDELLSRIKNSGNLGKIADNLRGVQSGAIKADDALKDVLGTLNSIGKVLETQEQENPKFRENFNKQADALVQIVKDFGKSEKVLAATKKEQGNRDISNALGFSFESFTVDFSNVAEIVTKAYGNSKEKIKEAFAGIFDNEDNKKALTEGILSLKKHISSIPQNAREDISKNLSEFINNNLFSDEKLQKAFKNKEKAKNVISEIVGGIIADGIKSADKYASEKIESGQKIQLDKVFKKFEKGGKLDYLANNDVQNKIREFIKASSELEYNIKGQKDNWSTDTKSITQWGNAITVSRDKVVDLAKSIHSITGIYLVDFDKTGKRIIESFDTTVINDMTNYMKKYGIVSADVMETLYRKSQLINKSKQLLNEFNKALQNAGNDKNKIKQAYDSYAEGLHNISKELDAVNEKLNKFNNQKELDKAADKITNAYVRKGGKSADIEFTAKNKVLADSLSEAIGKVNEQIKEGTIKLSEYKNQYKQLDEVAKLFYDKVGGKAEAGISQEDIDRFNQFAEIAKTLGSALVESRGQILETEKSLRSVGIVSDNLGKAIEKLKSVSKLKDLAPTELLEVNRAMSEATKKYNELGSKRDAINGLIERIKELKVALEGVVTAALAVAKAIDALSGGKLSIASDIQKLKDDLMKDFDTQLKSLTDTSNNVSVAMEKLTPSIDTSKQLYEGLKNVNKETKDLKANVNDAKETLEQFEAKLPSFKDQLLQNMKSASQAVHGWRMDMVDAVSDIGSGIVKAMVKGEDAMESLKNVLTSLADHFIEMGIRMMTYQLFWSMLGGGGMGMGGLFGGLAGLFHNGGTVGVDSPTFFRKYHTGGIVGSNEEMAILQKGESVLTRGQMAALGAGISENGEKGNVSVDVRFDPSLKGEITTEQEVIQQDNQMTRVVLNVIKQNRRTVSGILQTSTRAQ